MKPRISLLFLALALAAPLAAFADNCVTGCGATEPCDGYCVDLGRYEDCSTGETVILQYCQSFGVSQAPAFWSPAVTAPTGLLPSLDRSRTCSDRPAPWAPARP